MRRLFLALLLSTIFSAAAQAASMAFVYESDAAATAGRAWPAPLAENGVILPADKALAASATLLIGDAAGLYKAVLFRLDNDLNVAVLRKGEVVADKELLGRHLKRWSMAEAFLAPAQSVPADAAAQTFAAAVEASTHPFQPTINGLGPDAVVVLKKKFNKTKFKLQVVNSSTSPVWAMSIKLTSDPSLSFWKEGRRPGLNDVPSSTFTYDQQALFKSIKPGESISVTVEAYYMKGTDYTWTVHTRSKDVSGERKFAVRIE